MSSGVAWPVGTADAPPLRHLRVNGVDLAYIEQGTGVPVVFIHGSFSDLRIWERQRPAVAQSYHFIAYNQRDHGPEPWADAGQHYAVATHAAHLAPFLGALQAGPVHLVAHSSRGVIATLVALDHPDLVRSLTLAEPAIGTLLAALLFVDRPSRRPVSPGRPRGDDCPRHAPDVRPAAGGLQCGAPPVPSIAFSRMSRRHTPRTSLG
jgi:pimeloyl-ACP methyl ester carboxylesterase